MGIMNLWKKIRTANAEAKHTISNRKACSLLKKIDEKGYTPTDEEVAALKKVESIGLFSLPKSIDMLTNLKELDLSFAKITGLSGIENLTNLQELNLDKTMITSLSGIENLTNLRWLILSETKITDLSGIENLTNLQWLDLSETPITDLSGIENLTNLQWLNLNYTKIDSQELKRLSKLKNLTFLDLTYLELAEIPSQLLELNLPFDTTNMCPNIFERGIFIHGTVLTQQPLSFFESDRSLIEEYYKSEIASADEAEETKKP